MINVEHVHEFCNRMIRDFGAGFRQNPTPKGLTIVGEYPAASGQILSIKLNVDHTKIETRVHDATRRVIFSRVTRDNINYDSHLIGFLQRSVYTH